MLSKALIKIQTHRHTKTCKKNCHTICRFNFPFLPMDTTTILFPLEHTTKDNDKKKDLCSLLDNKNYSRHVAFDMFLTDLNLSKDKYMVLFHSCLMLPIILLKGKPYDI